MKNGVWFHRWAVLIAGSGIVFSILSGNAFAAEAWWGPPPSTIVQKTPGPSLKETEIQSAPMLFSNPEERSRISQDFILRQSRERAKATALATRAGLPTQTPSGELMAIKEGRIWFRGICNANAAISIATDRVRNQSPYSLSGAGVSVGMWDQALPLTTHIELTGHVFPIEGGGITAHSTLVAGSLAAAGINAAACGMAPSCAVGAYDWNNDLGEIASLAMATPGEAGKIQLSNHSYDYHTGWSYDGGTPTWYGIWGLREDTGFGMYDNTARDLDVIAYAAPYYLYIKAAGNDRMEDAPANGTVFNFWSNSIFQSKSYDASTDPWDDGWDQGGYDTIPHEQNAKNILTVGAVEDAVTNGLRCLSNAVMTGFSDWGPTDDGRVKPDLVANGVDLFSCGSLSNTHYLYYTGTSIATPTVTGSAALLLEWFKRLFPGHYLRASSLKGLILHTCDDLGRAGPDYQFGWGLMNTRAAADHLLAHARDCARNDLREWIITNSADAHLYYYVWDGTNTVKATLCWTDPPGTAVTNYSVADDPTPRLVHDLDLHIVDPQQTTNRAFILDATQPTNVAVRGDNVTDNIEQALIPTESAVPGLYRVVVSTKGALTHTQQVYSLVISGLIRADELRGRPSGGAPTFTWAAASGTIYTLESRSSLVNGSEWETAGMVTATQSSAQFAVTNATGATFYRFHFTP